MARRSGGASGAGRLATRIPTHSPAEALRVVAEAAGAPLAKAPLLVGSLGQGAVYRAPELRDQPIAVELAVAPTAWGPRLAWKAAVGVTGSPAAYDVLVDDRGVVFTVDRMAGGLYAYQLTV